MSQAPRDRGDSHPWMDGKEGPKIAMPDHVSRDPPLRSGDPDKGAADILCRDGTGRDTGADEDGVIVAFNRADPSLGFRPRGRTYSVTAKPTAPVRVKLMPLR